MEAGVHGKTNTDSQGRYGFPSGRLTPGRYQLAIRAAGYDLNDPGIVKMAADQTTEFDLRLQKTQDLPAQLMNAEWLTSFPGTPEQKRLATGCVSCHSLTLVARSGHDVAA